MMPALATDQAMIGSAVDPTADREGIYKGLS